jgi:anti-sigma factor RsiW
MKNACEKWKGQLQEAALTGVSAPELAEHLRSCTHCATELKDLEARRVRLDALLPQIIQGTQLSVDFRARVLAAAEAVSERKRVLGWRAWTLAGATVTVALLFVLTLWYRGSGRKIPPEELAAAQRLAEWHAPSDSLLVTPGQEFLRRTPKLGESYLTVPVKKAEEE